MAAQFSELSIRHLQTSTYLISSIMKSLYKVYLQGSEPTGWSGELIENKKYLISYSGNDLFFKNTSSQ